MDRHVQGRLVKHHMLEILEKGGWKETTRRIFTPAGTGDDLNREFERSGVPDSLLVSENLSFEGVSWQFSVSFPFRVLAGVIQINEKLDAFRVVSWHGLKTTMHTGCEFVIHKKNWEGLVPTQVEFLEQFKARLKDECGPDLPPKEPKRRSLSPKRSPPPLEPIPTPPKVTSIFWFEWGKKKELYPARMAFAKEIYISGKQHVYFFGSGLFDVFNPRKAKAWDAYKTTQKRHEVAIAEAKKYAGIN